MLFDFLGVALLNLFLKTSGQFLLKISKIHTKFFLIVLQHWVFYAVSFFHTEFISIDFD